MTYKFTTPINVEKIAVDVASGKITMAQVNDAWFDGTLSSKELTAISDAAFAIKSMMMDVQFAVDVIRDAAIVSASLSSTRSTTTSIR